MVKHKKVCKAFSYIEHLLILTSVVTGCVSISTFVLLVVIPVGNASSVVSSLLRVCMVLNYYEHFLIFVSAASGCISISALFHQLQLL